MKRSFAMILLLCLLLSPAARAMESEIPLSTATEKTDFLGISSVACLENTIYVLTYDALYTLDESGGYSHSHSTGRGRRILLAPCPANLRWRAARAGEPPAL